MPASRVPGARTIIEGSAGVALAQYVLPGTEGREGLMFDRASAALVFMALAAFAVSPVAQTTTPATPATPAAPAPVPARKAANAKPLSLTGCITHADGEKYTLNDSKHGLFQLIGKPLDIYIGKRVEVDGTST